MQRITYRDNTWTPEYWLLGWRPYKHLGGQTVEFMNADNAMDFMLEPPDVYAPLKLLIGTVATSAVLGFALVYLVSLVWQP